MSLTLPVCSACGRAAFPPRALCPTCGGGEWTTGEARTGTVEELTARDGVRIASVRTELGPVVIARVEAPVERGAVVTLGRDGGVPLVVA